LSDEFRVDVADGDFCRELEQTFPESFADWPAFCQAQHLETTMLMPGYILSSQGDRVSLAHAVEGRFPFLDHRLAEFAATIPPRLKMNGLNEKYLLKLALGELVPPTIVKRTKQPYRAPDSASFFCAKTQTARAEYVDELLHPARIAKDGIFNPTAVRLLSQKARQGHTIGFKDNMALVAILSTGLLVERFVRKFPRHTPPATGVTNLWPNPQSVQSLAGHQS
jgi:asparagine synthase (glutamine-hydrolysing)